VTYDQFQVLVKYYGGARDPVKLLRRPLCQRSELNPRLPMTRLARKRRRIGEAVEVLTYVPARRDSRKDTVGEVLDASRPSARCRPSEITSHR